MFNPYFSQVQDVLSLPNESRQGNKASLLSGLKALDGDRLLLLLLILVLFQEGRQEERWPLILALLYCMI